MNKCSGKYKNGQPCRNNSKSNGRCGRHPLIMKKTPKISYNVIKPTTISFNKNENIEDDLIIKEVKKPWWKRLLFLSK